MQEQITNKKKSYTIILMDSGRTGRMRTLHLSGMRLKVVVILGAVFLGLSVFSLFFVQKLYFERKEVLQHREENRKLKMQLVGYSSQLEEIKKRMDAIDQLELKVRDIVTLQKGGIAKRQGTAAAGARDYAAIADRREREFFDELNSSLLGLSLEFDKREMSLSDLVNLLEDEKLTMRSVPTIWPVKGWVSSEFGYRVSPFTGRRVFHEGIDVSSRYGATISSTAEGVVVFAGRKPGFGFVVTVDHGFGFVTSYSHCSKLLVTAGQSVTKGQAIAKVGTTGRSTGPHVHYEIKVNGIPVNPVKFIIDTES